MTRAKYLPISHPRSQFKQKTLKEMETVINMEPVFLRLPIVYTTRLDEMEILRKDLSKNRPQDIIESIISESKPRYNITNVIKHECDKTSQNQQTNLKLSFEKLKSQVEEVNSRSSNSNNEAEAVIKSEIETNMNVYSLNKLETLQALCKPLKIVLKDINKTMSKRNNEIKLEVLSISSDSDDDVITIGHDNIIYRTDAIIKNNTSSDKNIMGPTGKHIIKNINDFKDILNKDDLQNSIIVIYNLYLKELDAYQIGDSYNVTEYQTRKYTEVYKFPMKKCRLIINIIACCWRNRQSYVSLLLNYQQYNDIARFIATTHPCKKRCTCCCYFVEQHSKAPDVVNKPSPVTVNDSTRNNRNATLKCNSKLISTALKFKKNTKWNGYPEGICDLDDKNTRVNKSCNRLLQINNTKGNVEFYEFGRENLIYSKIINSGIDNSRWLLKTLNKCHNHLNFTFTNSADREKKIITYRHMMNIISFNTECFLRTPMTISVEVLKKSTYSSDKDQTKSYKIEHTRSFMGGRSKESKVLSIISKIRKTKSSAPPVGVVTSPSKYSSPSAGPQSAKRAPRAPRQSLQSTVMDQEVSQTINCLIRDILHRFRNVLLTINTEGKVSAALNAPLSSLTYSELQILSQILSHAQSQVDKLGLTPGTCLNPETPLVVNSPTFKTSACAADATNSTTCTTSTNSTDDTKSEKSDGQNAQTFKEQKKNASTKSTFLSNFSTIIGNKKHEYEKSFRSYLGDTLGLNPKITNVFSLNDVNYSSTNILESPLERSNLMIEIDSNISTETVNSSEMLTKLCVNEIREEITILDNEIESKEVKKRKRKNYRKSNAKPPKIRVKTTEEILVIDHLKTPLVSHDSEVVECDSTPSVPLRSMVKLDSNFDSDNNCIRNLLIAEPNKNEFLTNPQQVRQTTIMPFFEVCADGTIIQNRVFPTS